MNVCAPIHRTKQSVGWTVEATGQQIPAQPLHRYDCACADPRHCGAGWYASLKRARQTYERRLARR